MGNHCIGNMGICVKHFSGFFKTSIGLLTLVGRTGDGGDFFGAEGHGKRYRIPKTAQGCQPTSRSQALDAFTYRVFVADSIEHQIVAIADLEVCTQFDGSRFLMGVAGGNIEGQAFGVKGGGSGNADCASTNNENLVARFRLALIKPMHRNGQWFDQRGIVNIQPRWQFIQGLRRYLNVFRHAAVNVSADQRATMLAVVVIAIIAIAAMTTTVYGFDCYGFTVAGVTGEFVARHNALKGASTQHVQIGAANRGAGNLYNNTVSRGSGYRGDDGFTIFNLDGFQRVFL